MNDGRPTFDNVPQLYIDPVECIDCGACVPVCPVSAIFALDDLPEKWKQYTELNESYVKAASSHLRSSPNTKVSSRSLAFSSVSIDKASPPRHDERLTSQGSSRHATDRSFLRIN
jgi:ferredoxin